VHAGNNARRSIRNGCVLYDYVYRLMLYMRLHKGCSRGNIYPEKVNHAVAKSEQSHFPSTRVHYSGIDDDVDRT